MQELVPNISIDRHRHDRPYVAVVVKGSYLEAGDAGRRVLREGDVAFHRAFEAHANQVSPSGALIVNIPLGMLQPSLSFAQIDELGPILEAAKHDPAAAVDLIMSASTEIACNILDWPDMLARELRKSSPLSLEDWAEARSLTPSAISRGFRNAFGVSPKRYRLEARALSALERLLYGSSTAADVAIETGFADQAHMTRTLKSITGHTPSFWRKAKSVQAPVRETCFLAR